MKFVNQSEVYTKHILIYLSRPIYLFFLIVLFIYLKLHYISVLGILNVGKHTGNVMITLTQ